jgi:hypothetical protein
MPTLLTPLHNWAERWARRDEQGHVTSAQAWLKETESKETLQNSLHLFFFSPRLDMSSKFTAGEACEGGHKHE